MLQRRQNYARRRSGRVATFFRNLRWHGNPRLRVNPKGLWFDLAQFPTPNPNIVIDEETENILWNPQPIKPAVIYGPFFSPEWNGEASNEEKRKRKQVRARWQTRLRNLIQPVTVADANWRVKATPKWQQKLNRLIVDPLDCKGGRHFAAGEPFNSGTRLYWCDNAIPRCAAMVDGEMVLCSWVLTTTWKTLMADVFKGRLSGWYGKWHVISLPEIRTEHDAMLTWEPLRREVYSDLLLDKLDACIMYNDDGRKRRFLPFVESAKLPKGVARRTYVRKGAEGLVRSCPLPVRRAKWTGKSWVWSREPARDTSTDSLICGRSLPYHTSAERTAYARQQRKVLATVEPFTILQDVPRPSLEWLYGWSFPNPHQIDALDAWRHTLQCRAIEQSTSPHSADKRTQQTA